MLKNLKMTSEVLLLCVMFDACEQRPRLHALSGQGKAQKVGHDGLAEDRLQRRRHGQVDRGANGRASQSLPAAQLHGHCRPHHALCTCKLLVIVKLFWLTFLVPSKVS